MCKQTGLREQREEPMEVRGEEETKTHKVKTKDSPDHIINFYYTTRTGNSKWWIFLLIEIMRKRLT